MSENRPAMTATAFARIRRRLGMTQEQLAAVIGCVRTSVTHWERDAKPIGPTVARLMRLLDERRRAKRRGAR